MSVRARQEALDRYQQGHAWLGFPIAVHRKYAEEQGSYLAATISYYGFFSLFPLLLVLVTVLGYLFAGHPGVQKTILDSALAQFPVVGHDLQQGTLSGSGVALVVGLVVSLWAGTGVVLAAENAMNQLWSIPHDRRPGFVRGRGRAFLLLLVLGGGLLGTTILAGLSTVGAGYGVVWKIVSVALATLLDVALFWVGFRVITAADVSWRALRGGAIASAIAYQGLQAVGGVYVNHVVEHASNVYGTFALVIGLLSWIYLAATILLLGAAGNVVATRGLWPRSLSSAEAR
jgi:YihY family inner membrane protein